MGHSQSKAALYSTFARIIRAPIPARSASEGAFGLSSLALRAEKWILALALFVPRIGGADDVDLPFTTDDLASFTNPLDAGTYFHVKTYCGLIGAEGNYIHDNAKDTTDRSLSDQLSKSKSPG